MRPRLLSVFLLLAACSPAPPAGNDQESETPLAAEHGTEPAPAPNGAAPERRAGPAAAATGFPPVEPPAPGTPGGLADDRRPISEARFAPTSAQGAANVVQTYHALLEAGRYGDAWKLWSDGGKASGMTASAFAASFAGYAEYHAQIGAPGRIQGAAGSLYVTVPVVVYGRLKSGEEVHMNGPVTLRRVNGVPGSTAEQRKWHISASAVRPRPR